MKINYKEQIPILVKLQDVDSRLFNLRCEKEAKPLDLEDSRNILNQKKEHIDSLEEDIKNTKMAIKNKELDLHTAEDGIKRLNQQLFQIKSNEAYKALLTEIAGKKADNSLIEDNILDFMEELESKESNLNKEKENFKELESMFKEKEKVVRYEMELIEVTIAEEEKNREKIAQTINPELLSVYDRLLKKRECVAIVSVNDAACGGCHLSLRPQSINEIKRADALVTCERCSRILYLNE